jgi:Tol biopolymer transport system component
VWLPDSSGFVYTTSKQQLLRYDVATGKTQVLVADTGTKTLSPAVSPDGKRIAVARLHGKGKERDGVLEAGPDTLEIVVFDLDGKELHRFPEVV